VNEILWAVTQATALASLVLLTATFVLGLLTSGRAVGSVVGRTVLATVHRTVALLMTVFIGAHVITAIAETYVDIGWVSALVPFTSAYERGWIGLGAIAVDLVLAVIITSLLRDRIPIRAWRLIHLTTYALWPIALLHGIGSVTVSTTLTYAVAGICSAAALGAFVVRLTRIPADTQRRRAVSAHGWRVGVSS
jgi:predicted ferric reductase